MQLMNTIGQQCRNYLSARDWSRTDSSIFLVSSIKKIQDQTKFLEIMPSFAQAFWMMSELEELKRFLSASTNFGGAYPNEIELHVQLDEWKNFTNSEKFKKLFG